MHKKYCKKEHPYIVKWKKRAGGSQSWKKMLQSRDLIEHQIFWQTRNGNSSIWLDNWTTFGELYTINEENRE